MFFVESGKDDIGPYLRKLGQQPDWEAEIHPELFNRLGAHAGMFRRGLDCESSGYGIAAFAYYRRVVEDMIGGLIEQIPRLLDEKEKVAFQIALEEVRKTIVAQTKIELVKDLLPSRLRPDGINPSTSCIPN